MAQLPAYLQSLQLKPINEGATVGIGASQPPHISIRGNTFTLVDASGAQQPAGPVLDVCVADISNQMNKLFYGAKWTPDASEPPLCWSANGIGPSRDALEPQSPTCNICPNNERGSAVSALSGVAVKACRDELWLAVLIPSLPQVRFQFKITPGSFKNWQSYVKVCEGNQTQLNTILTRIGFQAGVNGVLTFQAVAYIEETTAKTLSLGYAEKAFDVLVGRNDVPRQGALPAPTQQVQQIAPFAAPAAATPSMQMAAPMAAQAPFATAAPPSEPAPRRRRRTQAEIAADNAAQGQTAQTTAPAIAPFRPQAPAEPVAPATNPGFLGGAPQAVAGNGTGQPAPAAQFGIAPGVAPNPELSQALDGLFGKK